MHDFAAYRHNMIESQIRPNQVTDSSVLSAFAEIPRETFVPARLAPVAYVDESIPLGGGRYLVEPRVTARLVQALAVKSTDKALVVGAATGYMAAILSRLAAQVVALEVDGTLAGQATQNLRALGIGNVTVVQGELCRGHAKNAPYDVILCDGAIAEIPPALGDQLIEGGHLATVILRGDGATGYGILALKTHGIVSDRTLFDAVTPLLPGCAPEPAFAF
jgi:protein-L-isoaspartate(D-aspartate) O-methyltransferase